MAARLNGEAGGGFSGVRHSAIETEQETDVWGNPADGPPARSKSDDHLDSDLSGAGGVQHAHSPTFKTQTDETDWECVLRSSCLPPP